MLKRPIQLALLLCTAWLSLGAAQAAELTMFSRDDFQGRDVTIRDTVSNLTALGFNDKAGSMIIRSGRWEVCQHADFRGDCRTLGPGEYRDLHRLNNNISSVREVRGGGRDDDRGGDRGGDRERDRDRDQRAPGVTLYADGDMNGRAVNLRGDVSNFQQLGFNDQARSMVIHGGSWEMCVHADFGGECRLFGPGEHRRLDRAFRNAISSARLVREGGHGQGRDRDRNRRDGGVELFGMTGFAGERMSVRDEMRNLSESGFNDRAGSLIVYGGQWEFCQHAEFRGQCLTYGPGRYDRLGSLHNQISSIRRVR
ncbi:MAG: beta/gamma crystallin-related protein [Pseudomonadota bacterium]